MTVDDSFDGFLSQKPLAIEIAITKDYGELINLCHRINGECHRLLFKLDVRNRDGQAMVVAALFLRALQHYQATILLLSKGLVAAGRVGLRATLESVFAIRTVAASEADFHAYVKDGQVRRLDLMKVARTYDYPLLGKLRESASDERFAALKNDIKETGARKLSVEELSKTADLHQLYVSVYALLSSAAHSGVRELDQHLVQDTSGRIEEIEYAPSREDIYDLLLTAGDFILLASDAVCRQFEIIDFADVRRELAAAIEAGIDTSHAEVDR